MSSLAIFVFAVLGAAGCWYHAFDPDYEYRILAQGALGLTTIIALLLVGR